VVITAQGGVETHCKGLLLHASVCKLGSLTPLDTGGPATVTQPRKCTAWAVVSEAARATLPDKLLKLHHTMTQRDEITAAARDPEVPFQAEALQNPEHVTNGPPNNKPPLLYPPARLQKLLKLPCKKESAPKHEEPPDQNTDSKDQERLRPPMVETRPPVSLSDSMLHMALTGTEAHLPPQAARDASLQMAVCVRLDRMTMTYCTAVRGWPNAPWKTASIAIKRNKRTRQSTDHTTTSSEPSLSPYC
jgi:hypothetical protein